LKYSPFLRRKHRSYPYCEFTATSKEAETYVVKANHNKCKIERLRMLHTIVGDDPTGELIKQKFQVALNLFRELLLFLQRTLKDALTKQEVIGLFDTHACKNKRP